MKKVLRSIEYDKPRAPVTADEVLVLDFLDRRGRLPPNPVTELELQRAIVDLPHETRNDLAAELMATDNRLEQIGYHRHWDAMPRYWARDPAHVRDMLPEHFFPMARGFEVVCPDGEVRAIVAARVDAAIAHAELLSKEPALSCSAIALMSNACPAGPHFVRVSREDI